MKKGSRADAIANAIVALALRLNDFILIHNTSQQDNKRKNESLNYI